MIISVIIPSYNEEPFLLRLFDSVNSLVLQAYKQFEVKIELIFVNDGSTDQTKDLLLHFKGKVINQINMGKGSAVRNGASHANGQYLIVLDADLEYESSDILKLIPCILYSNDLVAVYGSRYKRNSFLKLRLLPYTHQSLANILFNYLLSLLYLIKYRTFISDLLTGLKMYPTEIYKRIDPITHGFETDHELTIGLHNLGVKIIEVPINYAPRTRSQGKKIRFKDALKAIRVILK